MFEFEFEFDDDDDDGDGDDDDYEIFNIQSCFPNARLHN